jgi:phytoene dehydrogenase-like protein
MYSENRKDLIIIGGGINGLSAGLAYALNNDLKQKKVLVVEKGPISGGYVTSFARKGYFFDTCQMASNVSDVLDYFGISMDWKEFKSDFIRIFKADTQTYAMKTIELISGKEEFETQLIKQFPNESVLLRKYFDYSSAMFNELHGLKNAPNLADMFKMLFTCPKVIKNASKNFDENLSPNFQRST